MNLGVVSYDFDPPIGGLGVIARLFARSLPEQDPATVVTVISPASGADDRVSPIAYARWQKSGGCPLFSLVFNMRMHRIVRAHALDCLHLHAGSGGVFLLLKPRCPVVVTAHHTYLQEARYVFRGNPLKRCMKYLFSFLERRTYALADRITCVSHDTADFLRISYGVNPEKIVVVENPVSDEFFAPSPEVKAPQSIVYVGRIEERKGVMTLLDAFSILQKQLPDCSLALIGADHTSGQFTKEIFLRSLSDSVHLLGYLPQTDRIAHMRSATLIVAPSLLEGFGLVAAEAMALGVPLIVSDADGLRSIVRDGENGFVFPREDARSLCDVLVRVLSNPDLAASVARRAKADAEKRFQRRVQVRLMHDVFNKLLSSRHP